jgi:hypothetical protein
MVFDAISTSIDRINLHENLDLTNFEYEHPDFPISRFAAANQRHYFWTQVYSHDFILKNGVVNI